MANDSRRRLAHGAEEFRKQCSFYLVFESLEVFQVNVFFSNFARVLHSLVQQIWLQHILGGRLRIMVAVHRCSVEVHEYKRTIEKVAIIPTSQIHTKSLRNSSKLQRFFSKLQEQEEEGEPEVSILS